MLGRLPANKRNAGSQIMEWFCFENLIFNLDKPQRNEEHLADILNDFDRTLSQRGTLNDIDWHDMVKISNIFSRYDFI